MATITMKSYRFPGGIAAAIEWDSSVPEVVTLRVTGTEGHEPERRAWKDDISKLEAALARIATAEGWVRLTKYAPRAWEWKAGARAGTAQTKADAFNDATR